MRLPAIAAVGGAFVAAVAATQAAAQAPAPQLPYGIGNAVREGEQTRRQALPGSSSVPVLPRLAEPQFTLKDKEALLVRRFKVDGPPIVDEVEVQAVLAPYEGRKLTIAQIYEAADQATTIYRAHGYMIAKVYVPAQNARGPAPVSTMQRCSFGAPPMAWNRSSRSRPICVFIALAISGRFSMISSVCGCGSDVCSVA